MKKLYLILIITFSVLSLTCKEGTTSVITNGPFSLNIIVKDATGNPVPGLRVSAWNRLSLDTGIPSIPPGEEPFSVHAVAVVLFQDPQDVAHVILETSTLDGTPLDTLVNQMIDAGYHEVQVPITIDRGTAVIKLRLTASDTSSGTILFRDSVYSVLWQPDPAISVLGWTSATGSFQTTDKSLFPHLLQLPTLIHTNSDGPDSLGTFTILDTVAITLSDTAHNQSQQIRRIVQQGSNVIALQWNPTNVPQAERPTKEPRVPPRISIQKKITTDIPTHWKLHQTFPNPFN